ncbi:DEAD/DEAH box helicase, partial [Streptococcus agalactiae]|nr:DEAD/DEAH box helicase [Streptococcus agalactiae]
APSSEKQLKTLEKFGIFTDEIVNAGKAAKLLDRLDKRRQSGLTTPKQIRMLERYGFKNVGMWKFEVASNMINRIAASGWRLPKGINAREYQPE